MRDRRKNNYINFMGVLWVVVLAVLIWVASTLTSIKTDIQNLKGQINSIQIQTAQKTKEVPTAIRHIEKQFKLKPKGI